MTYDWLEPRCRAAMTLLGRRFGFAWTLIHAIETASVEVDGEEPDREREPARWSLWRRPQNGTERQS